MVDALSGSYRGLPRRVIADPLVEVDIRLDALDETRGDENAVLLGLPRYVVSCQGASISWP
jgi:hypothetical protein